MTGDFESKVVVVTGAASGIGRATVIAFAEAGAKVVAADVVHHDENAGRFDELGIEAVDCDVRDLAVLQRTIDGAVERHGRLDVLVNNAGVQLVKQITEISEAEWDQVMGVNLKAAFFGTSYAVRHMQRQGGGAIVNNASNAGLLPRAHDPLYSTSKLSLVGMTRSLALCHSKDRIRVNCVCPGPVGGTEMYESELRLAADVEAQRKKSIEASPLARAFDRAITTEEVAASILYLASDAACMVTGTAIAIDGGKSLGVPPKTD